jgi:acetyl-CoA carboxylase biotin carboxyl carrier protein
MSVDLEELAALIELLEGAGFTDFQYDKGDFHLTVRRGPLPARRPPHEQAPARANRLAAPDPQPSAPAGLAVTTEGVDAAIVRAPLFGAFYRSPKPGDPPFVEIGSIVERDTVVCIIEVMKLMNSVIAGTAGEIVGIYPQNGDMVEVEQALFAIRRAT